MDQHRIGLCNSLKLISFLLMSIILPIGLATERCSNCLDGECHASGQCIKGCIVGFADKYCQHNCQSTCKDAKCQLDKNTGAMICLSGCQDGYCGQQCKAPCKEECLDCDISTVTSDQVEKNETETEKTIEIQQDASDCNTTCIALIVTMIVMLLGFPLLIFVYTKGWCPAKMNRLLKPPELEEINCEDESFIETSST